MKASAVKIKKLPSTTKNQINQCINQRISLVGYKTISTKYKTPLIEFSNKTRMWVLNHEIKQVNNIYYSNTKVIL